MFTLRQLARHVKGSVLGNREARIDRVEPFEEAGPGAITLASGKPYLESLDSTKASAIIVPTGSYRTSRSLLVVADSKLAFAKILQLFERRDFQPLGISDSAWIGDSCQIHERVSIHPYVRVSDNVTIEEEVTLYPGVSIGANCRVGRGSTLHPNVTLYDNVSLGERVILHSGAVIGADGFGYVKDGKRQIKIPQIGRVEIHDDVEIGANSCVDRATFGATVIESGVKIDNLVHIAHNCHIGENTVIVGCVGISGSVEVGKDCILAGQCGIGDHIRIGDRSLILNKTAVTKDVPPDSVVSGLYGRDHREELKIQAVLRQLPQMYRQWREWEKLARDSGVRLPEDKRKSER